MRRLILCVFVLMTGEHQSVATIIVYEGFAYDAGSGLNGLNGGSGFSGGWFQDAHSYIVAPGSLSSPGGTLLTSGNSLQHAGDLPRARRHMASVLGTTGSTAYVSFLLRQDQSNPDGRGFGGLILGGHNFLDQFGTFGIFIGAGGGQYLLGQAGSAASQVVTGVPILEGETVLMVARLDFLAGPDIATLYLNPIPGSPEPISGTVLSTVDLLDFTQIAITNSRDTLWTTDEIRVATDWAGVTAAVPEPSSIIVWPLIALSFGGFGWLQKRKH